MQMKEGHQTKAALSLYCGGASAAHHSGMFYRISFGQIQIFFFFNRTMSALDCS